jgi:hypothetical protein
MTVGVFARPFLGDDGVAVAAPTVAPFVIQRSGERQQSAQTPFRATNMSRCVSDILIVRLDAVPALQTATAIAGFTA